MSTPTLLMGEDIGCPHMADNRLMDIYLHTALVSKTSCFGQTPQSLPPCQRFRKAGRMLVAVLRVIQMGTLMHTEYSNMTKA